MAQFIDSLRQRGRIAQMTDEAGLTKHLTTGDPASRRAYVGYDPTADSLTIGNMATIMLLAHFQRAGHTPIVVGGGGTGLIGDPSGKSSERNLMTKELVAHNVQSQRRIFSQLIDFSPTISNSAKMVNNADWLSKISFLDALRDIGKHFSVNAMIQRDSVRDRLNNREQGISYTEFSYTLLQAYDFQYLHDTMGVTVQMGGSDQWGNIVAGTDLIRRTHASEGKSEPETFGLTTPLVTKADGTKFGKSESGAVWMTADRTSPFAFYQFWLNAEDSQVINYLKTFTFLSLERINELEASHAKDPGAREAHRALAQAVTELLHGPTERANAEAAAKALFSGEVAGLPLETLEEIFASAPSCELSKQRLDGEGAALVDIVVEAKLAQSKREAREFLQNGSISINGRKATPEDKLKSSDLLHGKVIALRRGKKQWCITRWA